ncbi:hypothetical protein PIROE2DRAFT_14296 [Piromyces sp. E2]|nr:hypothetical protein PIROE2DRAFT_14296 [Piromyces sp. E2]|eukprot:OUM60040.1 hypothetical protein PIROE2DRAFT_14296 [Piromyces sp. E2]
MPNLHKESYSSGSVIFDESFNSKINKKLGHSSLYLNQTSNSNENQTVILSVY